VRTKTTAPGPKTNAADALCADGLMRPYPDAAEFLGVSKSTVMGMLARAEIPYTRVAGGDRRIPRRALVEYAERRLVKCNTVA